MKTDEQAAKEHAGNPYYMCKSLARGKELFLAGCQRKQSEADEKAMIFAEWLELRHWHYNTINSKWWQVGHEMYVSDMKTTAELYNSPEFEAYYEERKSK